MIKNLKAKLLLALLSVALLMHLTSCSEKYSPIEPTDEDMTVVGQVGGKDVYLDELRFITESNKKALENSDLDALTALLEEGKLRKEEVDG